MHRQLLLHLDVAHTIGEGRDDGFLGHLGDLEARAVEALDVLLQGLPGLLRDAAHVAHGRRPVTSTLEVGDEAGAHLVPGRDRAWGQVQEPGASSFLERHGEPVHHDLFISAGSFDAQLVELEELCRVGRVVVARRQVWLELAGPRDAAQLAGVGATACGGYGRLRLRESLALRVPMRCSWKQRGVLTRRSWSRVTTSRSRERPGSLLRARDFLAAPFLLGWRLTERVPPRGHAPWSHDVFLERRRLVRPRNFMARVGRGAAQRSGRRGRAPCSADELGDAVKPLFVDVVDGTVAQELVCCDERSSSLQGCMEHAGRWGSGAAVLPYGRVLRRRLLLV